MLAAIVAVALLTRGAVRDARHAQEVANLERRAAATDAALASYRVQAAADARKKADLRAAIRIGASAAAAAETTYVALWDSLRPALPLTLVPPFERLDEAHARQVGALRAIADDALKIASIDSAGRVAAEGLMAEAVRERDEARRLLRTQPRASNSAVSLGLTASRTGLGLSGCYHRRVTRILGLTVTAHGCYAQ